MPRSKSRQQERDDQAKKFKALSREQAVQEYAEQTVIFARAMEKMEILERENLTLRGRVKVLKNKVKELADRLRELP